MSQGKHSQKSAMTTANIASLQRSVVKPFWQCFAAFLEEIKKFIKILPFWEILKNAAHY